MVAVHGWSEGETDLDVLDPFRNSSGLAGIPRSGIPRPASTTHRWSPDSVTWVVDAEASANSGGWFIPLR